MSTGRFPFKKLAKYPHMKPEDIAVWERFISKNPAVYDTCDYDVPVGDGAPQSDALPENIKADGKILTQKKIDVVAYVGEIVHVIEVGPIADMRKLGQILTYTTLYTKEHPEAVMIIPTVVCGAVERELAPMFAEHGIVLEVVE